MHQRQKKITGLIKECNRLSLIYFAAFISILMKLARWIAYQLKTFTRFSLKLSKVAWHGILNNIIKFAYQCKTAIHACKRILIRTARQLNQLLKQVIYFSLYSGKLIKYKLLKSIYQITRLLIHFAHFYHRFSRVAWHAIFKQVIQFIYLYKTAGRTIAHLITRAARQITYQLHYLTRLALRLLKDVWLVSIRVAKQFIRLCSAIGWTIGQTAISLVRQIIYLLERFFRLCGRVFRTIYCICTDAVIKLISFCNIIIRTIKRFIFRLTRQILYLLENLGLLSLELLKAVWNGSVSGAIKFAYLIKVTIQALGQIVISSVQQIVYLLKIFGQVGLKLSKVTLHKFVNFCRWTGSLIIKAGDSCSAITKFIGRALANFFRWIGNLIIKFNRVFNNFCRWIGNLFVKTGTGCLDLIKFILFTIRWTFRCFFTLFLITEQYIWAKWLIIRERFSHYAQLIRLDKPIGIFLLLWPTLWALWIAAEGKPDATILMIFVLGVILMRSAGCAINDLVDRDLDAHVSRTHKRPIVSGAVSPREALDVAMLLVLFAFILVLFLNPLTKLLSLAGILLAIIYPFMKRYTYLPQFFLGLAFSWAVPMAFAAQTNSVPVVAWLLLMATVLWAMVYDTMYAMVDREDDIRIGIRSTAILFGDEDRVIIGAIQLLVLFALIMIGHRIEMSMYYYSGVATAAVFSLYQQFLIKDRIPENCFRAFLNNNWFGVTIFAGIFLHYYFK